MGSGNPEGEALSQVPLLTVYFTYPDRKKFTLLPQQEKGRFSPHLATQSISHHNPELSLSFNGLTFQTAPPNFLLSSIKANPSLYSGFAYGLL